MKKTEVGYIFTAFIVWRIFLFVVLWFAINSIPLLKDFLGGGYQNYIHGPFFWSWGNFDGQHYINIAQNGYGMGEYTFFPFYPFLINLIAKILGNSLFNLNLIGQVISNFAFLISLFGMYKLARLDYSKKVSRLSVILLLLFPTSFYFACVYTESLFLLFLVWGFYYARINKYALASIFGILLTLTRPIGIFVFPALLIEWLSQNKTRENKISCLPKAIFTIPSGLFVYMYFLKSKVNDSFAFFSQQVYVGEHRSSHIVLIPQILYRYLFKIFPNINYLYFPGLFFTAFEFFVGMSYLLLIIIFFWVTRLSYFTFSLLAYITPTFLGSFSSMPRYVVLIFPAYFVTASYLAKSKYKTFAFCAFSFILLVISFSLFARGYWLS